MEIYCCLEHVELALDEYVDEMEDAPKLEEMKTIPKVSTTTCKYCEKEAIYFVGN